MSDLKTLTHEAISSVSTENWQRCCKHVIEIENKMCNLEGIGPAISPVIVNLDTSDDETEENYSTSSSSDSSDGSLTEEYDYQ